MTNATLQQLTWSYMDVINSNGFTAFNAKTIEDAIKAGASRLERTIVAPFRVKITDDCVGVFSMVQESIFRDDYIVEVRPEVLKDKSLFGEVLSVLVDQLTKY